MKRVSAVALLGSAVALASVAGHSTVLFDGFSAQADDLLQPGSLTVPDIVVVGIDRDTLASIGLPWPWPRSVHAELLDSIAAGEPAVVVYDVVFADEQDDDDVLSAAMSRTPTVLASALTLRLDDDAPPLVVDELGPNEDLAAASAGIGHANVAVSQQRGVVRNLPFYALDERGIVVPSLAAAATAEIEQATAYIERDDGLQVGSRLVPLDDGALAINYSAGLVDAATVVSAGEVLDGTRGSKSFRDKIVIVGVTEPTLGDLHLVPNDKSGSVPGVLVHANAINTVLSRSWIEPADPFLQSLLLLVLAFVTVGLFVSWRLRYAAVAVFALLSASTLWSSHAFSSNGVVWDLLWPAITVALGASAAIIWRYLTEYRHRRRAQSLFSEYVPGDVMDLLVDRHALDKAARGTRVEVSLLFCDLRGFTPIAGSLTPSDVRRLLDHYYDYATSIIHEHGGTVMQFVGDEVFAIFGAPIPSASSGAACVIAARELIDDVGQLDERLAVAGLPRLAFGIGVHRGEVVAAHVGTAAHRQYSVIGDPVNVGSRLCSHAAAGQVVASEFALRSGGERGFVKIGKVELKGVAEPVAALRYGGEIHNSAGDDRQKVTPTSQER